MRERKEKRRREGEDEYTLITPVLHFCLANFTTTKGSEDSMSFTANRFPELTAARKKEKKRKRKRDMKRIKKRMDGKIKYGGKEKKRERESTLYDELFSIRC